MDFITKKQLIEQLQSEILPGENGSENKRVEFLPSSVTLKINEELNLKKEPVKQKDEDKLKQLEEKMLKTRELRRKNR